MVDDFDVYNDIDPAQFEELLADPMVQQEAIAGMAILGALSIFSLLFGLLVYFYLAFALMTLAKRMKMEKAWLAFIPVANIYLMSKMAKMPSWPIFLIIGAVIPIIGALFAIALTVFVVIWMWKIFEYFNKPGWWAVLMPFPLANIVFFVFLGITAWGEKGEKDIVGKEESKEKTEEKEVSETMEEVEESKESEE